MSQPSGSALALAQLGANALATLGDVAKHRRETPDVSERPGGLTVNNWFSVNRMQVVPPEDKKKDGGLAQNVATGVGIGIGIGLGIAAGAYLVDKFFGARAQAEEDQDLGGTVLEEEYPA